MGSPARLMTALNSFKSLSVESAVKNCGVFSGKTDWAFSIERVNTVTLSPRESSDSTKGLPTNPVPPVTKIFIIDCFQRAFEFVLKAI